jgi:hypothetical protein
MRMARYRFTAPYAALLGSAFPGMSMSHTAHAAPYRARTSNFVPTITARSTEASSASLLTST